MPSSLCLVADVGGTNTRVALANGVTVQPDSIRRFANAGHDGLASVLTAYLAEAGRPEVSAAAVAVAGPVEDGVARMTNLDWTIAPTALAQETGIARVAILNDLQAQGFALDHLAEDHLRVLIPGDQPAAPGRSGPRLVIGCGTGFNSAIVHDTRAGKLVTACETGHASLPVHSAEDLSLSISLRKVHGFAGVEDALSGRGLERVHAWAAAEAGVPAGIGAAEIMAAMATGDSADPVIRRAGEVFVRLLGTVAGDLALGAQPYGGIFLIGGVARAFTPYYEAFGLAPAFRAKGRFAPLMERFRLSLIEDDYAALTGAAAYLIDADLQRPAA